MIFSTKVTFWQNLAGKRKICPELSFWFEY
jgi:hypothetical protein